ncbi:D-aminoacylase [Tilletiaria anomala UBC 951]|uniref:D-aminoacylase n=1 Tax=Tilletiaria anomala (strain ATCC 24038 / CBS 436.72 / UBC 951) TaxID=1037660 RepID=A0A066V8M0_TILAU|nr:D-aminoacylase [Tilletiaria anomala UBC 951]KDN36638.1 D-aminoacylase [Tilletiaria anomala UBC 951]
MSVQEAAPVLIRNATIIDGMGSTPRYIASVLIREGTIHKIFTHPADVLASERTRVIDCEDGRLTVCPGFIDMHAHSDLSLLHTPEHFAKVTQGVTTEVIGQDGIAYAPVDPECLEKIRTQIAGWNGNPEDETFWSMWKQGSVSEYLDLLDTSRIATNAAFLVPQGNLRMLVLGYNQRPATLQEITRMQEILLQSLEQGAVGMSSGLTYVPGMYAADSELGQLLRIVAQYGAYYCPHTRSYGKGALQAYAEMIALAKETGVRLHLTHATLKFAENSGRAGEFLALIDNAIQDGVDITLDTYPYMPGSTTLAALLPSWAAAGGTDSILGRLNDPVTRKRIQHDVEVVGTDGCHGCTLEWDTIEISGVGDASLASRYVGRTLASVAAASGRTAFEELVYLLQADKLATTILQHVGHEENVRAIMRHPKHCGGSDGILTSTKPHPRGWGTFPRFLGHYARDLERGKERDLYSAASAEGGVYRTVQPEKIFDGGLEEAVSHLTYRAARVLRLQNRGLIKEGYRADLVIFDPKTICDQATFNQPQRQAKGVQTVLVNGHIVLDEGVPNGARSGQTIRMRRSGQEWTVS